MSRNPVDELLIFLLLQGGLYYLHMNLFVLAFPMKDIKVYLLSFWFIFIFYGQLLGHI